MAESTGVIPTRSDPRVLLIAGLGLTAVVVTLALSAIHQWGSPKETGDGHLSRPPSHRGRNQARLVVASAAVLTLVSAAPTSLSTPTASAWIGLTGGCSAHRPALGRALGGRDVCAL